MPKLSEISYSRDGTIAAVRDYYHFLTKMYLPDSAILEPPTDGWPSITEDSMRTLGKTDEVVALLRHLPYIVEPSDDKYRMQGAPWAYFVDWHCGRLGQELRAGDREAVKIQSEGRVWDEVPAHVVGLTVGGATDVFFLLDTQLGIVHWLDCPEGVKRAPPARALVEVEWDEVVPENEVEWREDCATWSVEDFFEVLKGEFRALRAVPINERTVYDSYTTFTEDRQGVVPLVQGVFREHGWPDLEVYDKEKCLKAVQKALEEHYYDESDKARM
ncbi:hypothetical protein F4779DRAFT_592626 [Xylariaceae sp. FL0662B]|nr:hypothetical protein F4779DRAFT_592626 [Xylariaceae sp. FL0662B]